MSYDELELDLVGDRKTALFVIISDTDDTFNFIVSIMYTQLFNLLCDRADVGCRTAAYFLYGRMVEADVTLIAAIASVICRMRSAPFTSRALRDILYFFICKLVYAN